MASGWSVFPAGKDLWQWSAFGPAGGNRGTATSEKEAEKCARRAERQLSRLVGADNPQEGSSPYGF